MLEQILNILVYDFFIYIKVFVKFSWFSLHVYSTYFLYVYGNPGSA